MAPKKKGGDKKKDDKKGGDASAEMTEKELLEQAKLRIESLEQQLVWRGEKTQNALTAQKELQERVNHYHADFEREKEEIFDISADMTRQYKGMQEELITQLSQIPGLRVASRTSTARYATATATMPDIGRELGVDAVIEGSVRRAGNQVRVSVALYHAASETSLWSGSFDRELEDLFALQSEVALEIAGAVQGQVDAEDASLLQRTARRDVDPDAADAYLRGRYEAEKGTPEGYRAAVDHFQTAFEEDSTFAPALAGLAGSRFLLTMALPEMPGA